MLVISPKRWGPMAEWLCSGLQNRVHRFNSGSGLHLLENFQHFKGSVRLFGLARDFVVRQVCVPDAVATVHGAFT